MRRIVKLPHGGLAVRSTTSSGEQLLLTVPPMHPMTSREARVQVFELVLRGLFGEAATIADIEREAIEFRDRGLGAVAALMAETPHRGARGAVAA